MKKNKCDKCSKVCNTTRGLVLHTVRMHPYVAPVAVPKVTIEDSIGEEYSGTFKNARNLDVGDIFYRVEKHVVKKIKKTEGLNDVFIVSEITKKHWQNNKPE